MISALSKEKKIPHYFVILLLILWGLYTFIYLFLIKNKLNSLAGYFPLVGQISLDFIASFLTFKLYRNTVDRKEKIIYLMFFISFIFACIADSIYHVSMNILNVKYFFNINSFFEIPFSIFLLFQAIAWGHIFFLNFGDIKKKQMFFPYAMLATLFFIMFTFGIPWKIDHFSLLGIYQSLDTIFEIIGFTLVAACFARANSITIYLASLGYLLVISSDLLIRYDVISGFIPVLHAFEATWVLGLLLMALSFFFGKKQFKLLTFNSLQSYISIWVLNIFLFFTLLLLLFNNGLSHHITFGNALINKNLLLIIIPCSIFSIFSSNFLAKRLLHPLRNIETIINDFMENKEKYLDVPENKINFNAVDRSVPGEMRQILW